MLIFHRCYLSLLSFSICHSYWFSLNQAYKRDPDLHHSPPSFREISLNFEGESKKEKEGEKCNYLLISSTYKKK